MLDVHSLAYGGIGLNLYIEHDWQKHIDFYSSRIFRVSLEADGMRSLWKLRLLASSSR